MSPEAKAPEATPDAAYVNAVQKQQIEAGILNSGENFDQARVDTLLSQTALEIAVPVVKAEVSIDEAVTPAIEVNEAGADLLANLTTDPSEESSDVVEIAAAKAKADMDNIFNKQQIDALAMKNSWTEDKYQEELAKAGLK